jgi:hypothetical protein
VAEIASASNTRGQALTVEDRLAIQELIARFAHCSDFGDWDGLATLYVPEIVTELEGLPVSYSGIPAQIEHAKVSDQQTQGKNRHYNFNFYIEAVDEKVVARYTFMNVNAGATPMAAQIVTSGRMRDTVVKTSDGWKLARRQVSFDQTFELDW